VPGNYYLSGVVRPADYTDDEKIEKLLRAEVDGKAVQVHWQHNGNFHDFLIKDIISTEAPYPLLLKWDGKPINFDFTATDTVTVPQKNAFQVLSVQVDNETNTIRCVFSHPLDAKQKYDSYVQVGTISRLRYTTSSNMLEIHLPQKPDNASVKLTLKEGLKGRNGVVLKEDYTADLIIEELKPALRTTGHGVIMPASEGLAYPFQAVSLRAVDVKVYRTFENNVLQFLQVNDLSGKNEMYRVAKPIATKTINLDENQSLDLRRWNTFSLDMDALVHPEPGAIYMVEISFRKEYAKYSLCEGEAQGSGDNEHYDWYRRNDPCHVSYYTTDRWLKQNVLASDIGLVAKRGSDNYYLAFVTSLSTAQPMSGAKVSLYNYQQQKIGEATSDGNGVAQISTEDTPYIMVAQHGHQKSYLRVDNNQSLSLSTFDVAGTAVQKGLKGTIYGERGVWRPGDTLFLTFVLEDRARTLPANHPVSFKLYNVHNQLVNQQVRTEGHNGFYTFICPTDAAAPAGNWEAVVQVGGVTFSKSLRIATIKPNRLKIETSLAHDPVLPGQKISGTIKAQWLHGAQLSGNEADVSVRLLPASTTFKGFADYVFEDHTKRFTSEEERAHTGHLDGNGSMHFELPVNTNKQASGKLRAAVAVRVFEDGGEFSTDNFSVNVEPYAAYAGLKMPKGTGYYNRLETDKDQLFEVVALDPAGKPLQRTLTVEIFHNEWSWWWFSSDGSLADYTRQLYANRLYSKSVKTGADGKASFTYRINYPDWGLYLVRVSDPESGHSVTQKVYIDWWHYGRGTDDGNSGATMLTFRSDKERYNVGEEAVITIPSAEGTTAIVTVENGSRVLSSMRVACKAEETQITLQTTAEMTPNAYVFVTLLQPHKNTVNDLPMRLYGVIPLVVEDPATRIHPEISMTDVIRPETPFKVQVKEAGNREMTYTIAIVDEGLLDITRFKTPDLWAFFFQREALGVRTWDLYNFVMGAYGGKIEQLFAIGGGDDGDDRRGGEKTNRFKPVVQFAGPFTLAAGKTGEHTFTLSNYVGSVRTMVVAGNGTAYGTAEKTVPVRSPLMLQATLPRVLGPGEVVTLPAAVFAMENHVKNVSVSLQANDLFEPLDGTGRSLTFTAPGDDMVRFRLRVKDKLGEGRVKLTAVSGSERAENEIVIAIRASNPPVVASEEKIVQSGQSLTLQVTPPGMEGTNTAQIEVSGIPPLNLGERLRFLLCYPNGCLEQTTSAAFPQLFLPEVVEMSPSDKDRAASNVRAALQKLTYFVRFDGSFSYWPGTTNYVNEWANNYAGHFLMEAERKGYRIPGNMKENWITSQQKAARNWDPSAKGTGYTRSQNDFTQAYRLYVLALAKKQELSAMNRLRDRKDLSPQARWMLAGAYALAGQPEAAKSIIDRLEPDENFYYEDPYDTYGSKERDEAIVLDALLLTGQQENAFRMARRISEALNGGRWMSTQTTAYCLLSLSKYALREKGDLKFSYSTGGGKTETVNTSKSLWQATVGSASSVHIENKGNTRLFVRLSIEGTPARGKETASANNLHISVRYSDMEGNILDVSRIPQGTDFEAEVKVTNIMQMGYCSNMALTQIFPSGWEIVENRLEDAARNDGVTYRDIRDDRVLSYFNLSAGHTQRFRTRLRAAYTGKFYLPAVACEAMYDNTVHANTQGMEVEVYAP
jgi:uncharacterized protein YfaS (alpha-2-macroglobulin family)